MLAMEVSERQGTEISLIR